jgi:hypothetical protein
MSKKPSLATEREILDRIRAISDLQSDFPALRRVTGQVQFERPDKAQS